MIGRRAGIVIAVVLLLVIALFLVTGSLNPPDRLRTRPSTATPITPTATAVVKPATK